MPPRLFSKHSIRLLVVVGVTLAVVGGAVALTFEFEHTIPGTTFPAAALVVRSACSGALPASGIVSSSPTNAWAIFSCSGDSTPTQATPAILLQDVGNATASFTAPAGVTDVWLIINGLAITTGCNQGHAAGFNLTANPVVRVTSSNVGEQLNYCIDGAPGSSFTTFTISWSQ